MDFKNVITGLLSKAYNVDNGKIAELLEAENITEETVLSSILDLDTARVTKLKEADTGKFQEGYQKAKKEVLTQFEKDLKTQYGIESDKMGLELITEIVTEKTKSTGTNDDDILRHPLYQTLENKYRTETKRIEDEWQQKVTDIQNGYKKNETFAEIQRKALTQLDELKPILPTNATVAANQKQWFVNSLKSYDFDLQENGNIVITKDGKVQQDAHGNSTRFEDLVKTIASQNFEFQANNGGGNAGNGNNDTPTGINLPAGVKMPTTLDEMTAIANNKDISAEDKEKVFNEFEKNQK